MRGVILILHTHNERTAYMRFDTNQDWPERAKRSEWAKLLDCHPLTLKKMEKTGLPAENPSGHMTYYRRVDILKYVMQPRIPRIIKREERIKKLRNRLAKLTGENA
jgi:hypothetical protein